MAEADPATHRASAVAEAEFKAVLGHFASGVCVVAGIDGSTGGGGAIGLSLQSFFSLSVDPPLIAIAPAHSSGTWPGIEASGAFCVNVLRDDQEALCRAFARSGVDKFEGVGWEPTATGSPRLSGVVAWVDCRVAAVHPAGDHSLVVGEVVGLGSAPGDPLVFYRGGFGGFRV